MTDTKRELTYRERLLADLHTKATAARDQGGSTFFGKEFVHELIGFVGATPEPSAQHGAANYTAGDVDPSGARTTVSTGHDMVRFQLHGGPAHQISQAIRQNPKGASAWVLDALRAKLEAAPTTLDLTKTLERFDKLPRYYATLAGAMTSPDGGYVHRDDARQVLLDAKAHAGTVSKRCAAAAGRDEAPSVLAHRLIEDGLKAKTEKPANPKEVANTIFFQGHDAFGTRRVTGSRSTTDVGRDVAVMMAALDFRAAAHRGETHVTPELVWRHVIGTPLPEADNSTRQQAASWEAVAQLLNRVCPSWARTGESGRDGALKAIQAMYDRAENAEATAAEALKKYDEAQRHLKALAEKVDETFTAMQHHKFSTRPDPLGLSPDPFDSTRARTARRNLWAKYVEAKKELRAMVEWVLKRRTGIFYTTD